MKYLVIGLVILVFVIGIILIIANKAKQGNPAEETKKPDSKKLYRGLAIGIALGTSIGVGIGVAIDNIGVGIAIGLAIGVGIGMAIGYGAKDKH